MTFTMDLVPNIDRSLTKGYPWDGGEGVVAHNFPGKVVPLGTRSDELPLAHSHNDWGWEAWV
jgi:hypothetical protein